MNEGDLSIKKLKKRPREEDESINPSKKAKTSPSSKSVIILAIVGGRNFKDRDELFRQVDLYIKEIGVKPSMIISGGAKGADTLAKSYAKERHIPFDELVPDWGKKGRNAGLLRNTDIVERSTHLIAFPTKESKGTWDSIRKAQNTMKPCKIIQ